MYFINIQLVTDKTLTPKRSLLRKWAKTALEKKIPSAEITLRIVDTKEMADLNSRYRQKNGPTNVLSFPFMLPDEIKMELPILGDIVICADVVNREAQEQHKTQESHWAHMVIHGVLHLLGYDHEMDNEAGIMEAIEIEIMQSFGFANPYEIGEDKIYD